LKSDHYNIYKKVVPLWCHIPDKFKCTHKKVKLSLCLTN
jgi:hypothetical protein